MTNYNNMYNKKNQKKRYETYVVDSQPGLYLRDEPGGDILTTLSDGTRVSSSGNVKELDGNIWVLVKAGNYDGYAMEKFLKKV